MAQTSEVRPAALNKFTAEIDALTQAGFLVGGSAFAPVLFLKGNLSLDEKHTHSLLSGQDGKALAQALGRLGYAPEEWCALSTTTATGKPCEGQLLRQAVAALDPSTVIILDGAAQGAFCEAYASELVLKERLDQALVEPGVLLGLLGMRVLNVGDFAASLIDPALKRQAWERLKLVPRQGAPY